MVTIVTHARRPTADICAHLCARLLEQVEHALAGVREQADPQRVGGAVGHAHVHAVDVGPPEPE
eukprot:5221892-Alexandrium_andersonii.AAC.1